MQKDKQLYPEIPVFNYEDSIITQDVKQLLK